MIQVYRPDERQGLHLGDGRGGLPDLHGVLHKRPHNLRLRAGKIALGNFATTA